MLTNGELHAVAARGDIPALLDEIRRLREQLDAALLLRNRFADQARQARTERTLLRAECHQYRDALRATGQDGALAAAEAAIQTYRAIYGNAG